MARNKTTVFRAKWVIPVSSMPIENGMVVTKGGRIVEVGTAFEISVPESATIISIDDGVIVPGLINAHTHLEFSDLECPIGTHGTAFTDWVRQVIRFKLERDANVKTSAIEKGLAELVDCGTVAVGEIATDPFEFLTYFASPATIHKTIFLEQLGGDESQLVAKQERAESFVTATTAADKQPTAAGLSPHAPYSVHRRLLKQLVDQSRKSNVCMAMHLAESLEEIELLEHQSGPFVDLLKDLGVWNAENFDQQYSIDSILNSLSLAPAELVVHGNYLTESQLDFIQSTSNMRIVFCPRTHRLFEHSRYPMQSMLDRNITVAIGTDSRASNPDLNLLGELKLIAESFAEVERRQVLEFGTLNGAIALGIDDTFGSIEQGKSDQLTVIKSTSLDGPFDWLDDENSQSLPAFRMN